MSDDAPSGLDWPALMTLGLSHLRLRPAEFWALTPAELKLMAGPLGPAAPLGRDALDALMAQFPDDTKEHGGDGF
ncbi:MAG: rcc01693 family protein [Pseudomonadota bacterium]